MPTAAPLDIVRLTLGTSWRTVSRRSRLSVWHRRTGTTLRSIYTEAVSALLLHFRSAFLLYSESLLSA
eukprot:189082-Chlamydomonas_euryale.AAC.1